MRPTIYIDARGYLFCPDCVRLYRTDPHYANMITEPLSVHEAGDCPGEESCDHCTAEAMAFNSFQKIGTS